MDAAAPSRLVLDDDPATVADRLLTAGRARPGWLERVVDALDARRTGEDLGRVLAVWDLSQADAGRLFDVSRQAVGKWLANGVPVERAAAVADLAAATDILVHHLKRERIPAVVRRPAPALDGASLLDLVAAGDTRGTLEACRAMFDVYRAQR